MPTAAKLVSGLFFAALAWLAAEAFKPLMPPETVFGIFSLLCAVFGLFVGWMVMGSRVGKGMSNAIGAGITTSVALTVVCVFYFSAREMIIRSMNRRYGGPLEATVSTFEIAFDYTLMLINPLVLGILLVGGVLGGMLAEATNRRWS